MDPHGPGSRLLFRPAPAPQLDPSLREKGQSRGDNKGDGPAGCDGHPNRGLGLEGPQQRAEEASQHLYGDPNPAEATVPRRAHERAR